MPAAKTFLPVRLPSLPPCGTTDGASEMRFSTLRPFSGSSCTGRAPTVVATDALCVCSSGAAPVTVSVSVMLPSTSVTSRRGVVWTLTSMPSRTQRWNPVSSTSSRYEPGTRFDEPGAAVLGTDRLTAFARALVDKDDGGTRKDTALVVA